MRIQPHWTFPLFVMWHVRDTRIFMSYHSLALSTCWTTDRLWRWWWWSEPQVFCPQGWDCLLFSPLDHSSSWTHFNVCCNLWLASLECSQLANWSLTCILCCRREIQVILFHILLWITGQEHMCPTISLSSTRVSSVKSLCSFTALVLITTSPLRCSFSRLWTRSVSVLQFPTGATGANWDRACKSLPCPMPLTVSLPSYSLCTNFTPDHEVGAWVPLHFPLIPRDYHANRAGVHVSQQSPSVTTNKRAFIELEHVFPCVHPWTPPASPKASGHWLRNFSTANTSSTSPTGRPQFHVRSDSTSSGHSPLTFRSSTG